MNANGRELKCEGTEIRRQQSERQKMRTADFTDDTDEEETDRKHMDKCKQHRNCSHLWDDFQA